MLVRNLVLSFDPAQKGWMENIGGYVAPTEIGEVMRGSGVGEVIASNDPGFSPGRQGQRHAALAGLRAPARQGAAEGRRTRVC